MRWRAAPVLRLWSILALTVILAPALGGCIGAGEQEAEPASTDGQDETAMNEPAASPIVREHTLFVPYYVRAATVDSQNMEETNWEVQIPENVTEVRAKASWDPSTPFAQDQALMLHEGSKEDAGEMFGGPGLGSSPIETPWTEIPEGLETVTIMCHVYTSPPHQPLGVEYEQETQIVVEFR